MVTGKLCPVYGCALLVSTPVLIKHQLGSEGAQKEEFWAFLGAGTSVGPLPHPGAHPGGWVDLAGPVPRS